MVQFFSMVLAKDLLPHGLVRFRESIGRIYRLSSIRSRAILTAFNPHLLWEARWSNLDLLPAHSLSKLEYVVDVGANDGTWSRVLLRYSRPKALIAIEPNPLLEPSLRKLAQDFPQVAVLSQAVGGKSGSMPFHVTGHSHNSSLLRPLGAQPGFVVSKTIEVAVVTLDDATRALPYISLLKLDLQGYELFALKAAKSTLAKTQLAMIEVNFVRQYEGMATFPEVHQAMESAGFQLVNLSEPIRENGLVVWADALYRNRVQE
jgi:FkbM family methyltransferase